MRYSALPRFPGLTRLRIRTALRRAWQIYGGPPGAVVEIAFLDAREHTDRHEQFLGDASETDVLAFGYGDPDLFGEILINADLCRREAAARGVDPVREALLYAVHGALHLLGFRDGDPGARAEMRAAEARVLSEIFPG